MQEQTVATRFTHQAKFPIRVIICNVAAPGCLFFFVAPVGRRSTSRGRILWLYEKWEASGCWSRDWTGCESETDAALQRRWERIRKIWRPLFDRIALLEAEMPEVSTGGEVRRKVLQFLREHTEEIAPTRSAGRS